MKDCTEHYQKLQAAYAAELYLLDNIPKAERTRPQEARRQELKNLLQLYRSYLSQQKANR